MPVHLGRYGIDYHRRAIHIQQTPDAHCRDCHGAGGWWEPSPTGPDPVTCHCTDRLRHIRIPLWRQPRRHRYEETPF